MSGANGRRSGSSEFGAALYSLPDSSFYLLRDLIAERCPTRSFPPPVHAAFRAGDVRHSEADIGKARRLLGYLPQFDVRRGLREALPWYEQHLRIEATANP